MMGKEKTISYHEHASVAWLFLDRPSELNSITREMLDEIEDVLDQIEGEFSNIRVLVITGKGKAFSSGADLQLVAQGADVALEFLERAQGVWLRISNLQIPVIAAVNGIAMAGGLELALAADIITASTDARVGDGHLNVGLIPGIGGATNLSRRLPLAIAKAIVLTGEILPASRVYELGLISYIWKPEDLLDKTGELAARIAKKSPVAVRKTLEVMDASFESSLSEEEGFRVELEANREFSHHLDFDEGVRAFLEKREPSFTGE